MDAERLPPAVAGIIAGLGVSSYLVIATIAHARIMPVSAIILCFPVVQWTKARPRPRALWGLALGVGVGACAFAMQLSVARMLPHLPVGP